MANRYKGEISLTADDKTYTLAFNTRAMAALEDHFSTPDREVTYDEVMKRVEKGSVRAIVGLLYAMAVTHHPDMTYAQMERVVDAAGGILGISQIVQKALIEMNPDASDLEALGITPDAKRARPQQAGRANRGTKTSTATLGAPASAAMSSGR